MGTDNLHHKDKKRSARSLERQRAKRRPYDRVLIVCEGAKTEPGYFEELKSILRLATANITICGKECNSDPLSIVNFALEKYHKDNDYDRVYCIFDKYRHTTYQMALDKIEQCKNAKRRSIPVYPANSVPCFEFWLLLHFKYTSQYFQSAGHRSICDQVIRELKNFIPHYAKGHEKILAEIAKSRQLAFEEVIDYAIRNGQQLEQQQNRQYSDNPSTRLHQLVAYLRDLNKAF